MINIFQKRIGAKVLWSVFCLVILTCLSVKAQEDEQKLTNKIPKKLPLKIEVINGNAPDMLSEIRLKVTNTGEKPIYFLKFYISTTEDFLSPDGLQYAFALRYGRSELITFSEPFNESDKPLLKDETYEFKVSSDEVRNFREYLQRSSRSAPEKYTLSFQLLNYGDGTGFWGSKGSSFSTKTRAKN